MDDRLPFDEIADLEDIMQAGTFERDSQALLDNTVLHGAMGETYEEKFNFFKDLYLSADDDKEVVLSHFNPVNDFDDNDVFEEFLKLQHLISVEESLSSPPHSSNDESLPSSVTQMDRPNSGLPRVPAQEGAPRPPQEMPTFLCLPSNCQEMDLPQRVEESLVGQSVVYPATPLLSVRSLLNLHNYSRNPLMMDNMEKVNNAASDTQNPRGQGASGVCSPFQETVDDASSSHHKVICPSEREVQLGPERSGKGQRSKHLVPQRQYWRGRFQSGSKQVRISKGKPEVSVLRRILMTPSEPKVPSKQLDRGASASETLGAINLSELSHKCPPEKTARGCDCLANGDLHNNDSCYIFYDNLNCNTGENEAIKAKTTYTGGKHDNSSPPQKVLTNNSNSAATMSYEGSNLSSSPETAELSKDENHGSPPLCISWEAVETTCVRLLARGQEAEEANYPKHVAEQLILEEFGKCVSQIFHM
ncbi:tesmin-like [Tachyglossus aculeatus]|uniref:tesmin-like n=1 Tax=Tachyglossus aculeatus TaxID=9261 RepID=UPI0018F621F2|nr:tesmin-like [Tachyglossus aculeatus]